MTDTIGIAMVGARAFGEFCLKAFAQVAGLKIVAVVDSDFARAQTLADKYEATAYSVGKYVLSEPKSCGQAGNLLLGEMLVMAPPSLADWCF